MRIVVLILFFVVTILSLCYFGGALLVRNDGVPSDVAIVQGGDDRSYWPALSALERREVKDLLVNLETPDVEDDIQIDAKRFVDNTAADLRGHIFVVPVDRDSDLWMKEKLRDLKVRSVVIFVPEYCSRLERTRLSHRYPQYRWSVTAVRYDDEFDRHWWRKRAWAKRFLTGVEAWVKWAI